MSARDGVGHPDFHPKGSRSNVHSQHKGPGGLPGRSATGRESWNCPQQENLRDCRTQVLSPRPLGPAKLSIEAKQKAQRETEREREREREREGKREKQQEGGGALLLGDGEASPSRSLVGAASREENESRRTKALLTDSEGLERATALGQKY